MSTASMSADTLTLGVISAIVAGDIEAVEHMLVAMAAIDPKRGQELLDAIARGNAARKPAVSEEER